MPARLLGRPASSRFAATDRAATARSASASAAAGQPPTHAGQGAPGIRPAAARPRMSRSAPRAAVLGEKEWRREACVWGVGGRGGQAEHKRAFASATLRARKRRESSRGYIRGRSAQDCPPIRPVTRQVVAWPPRPPLVGLGECRAARKGGWGSSERSRAASPAPSLTSNCHTTARYTHAHATSGRGPASASASRRSAMMTSGDSAGEDRRAAVMIPKTAERKSGLNSFGGAKACPSPFLFPAPRHSPGRPRPALEHSSTWTLVFHALLFHTRTTPHARGALATRALDLKSARTHTHLPTKRTRARPPPRSLHPPLLSLSPLSPLHAKCTVGSLGRGYSTLSTLYSAYSSTAARMASCEKERPRRATRSAQA